MKTLKLIIVMLITVVLFSSCVGEDDYGYDNEFSLEE